LNQPYNVIGGLSVLNPYQNATLKHFTTMHQHM